MNSLRFSHAGVAGCLMGLAALASSPTFAADSRIELSDGSIITGELVSVEKGQYLIRSATLGEIRVPESSVNSLRPLSSEAAAAPRAEPQNANELQRDYSADIAAIQQRVTSNPDLMQQIMSLQNDPDIQAAVSDPEFARLILAGDLDKVRGDARFQRLMEHPTIRAIMGQIAH